MKKNPQGSLNHPGKFEIACESKLNHSNNGWLLPIQHPLTWSGFSELLLWCFSFSRLPLILVMWDNLISPQVRPYIPGNPEIKAYRGTLRPLNASSTTKKNKMPPKSVWTGHSGKMEKESLMCGTTIGELLDTPVVDTRPLLLSPSSMWGSGLQGWVVCLGLKSDVCVGECEPLLCQGRGAFVLLTREVGPTD